MNWEAWAQTQADQITKLKAEVRTLKQQVRRLTESRDRWRTYAVKGRPTWTRRRG